MKNSLVFLAVFLMWMGSAQASRPTHYLFFVHGLGGSPKTFGHMPEALIKHMNETEPTMEHTAFRFGYPTGDQIMDGEVFAVQLGDFIHENLKDRIAPGDKISFISHSQGGLVSLMWYFHAYFSSRSFPAGPLPFGKNTADNYNFHPQYVPYLDAMISVGTPYWGSKLASFLSSEKNPNKYLADKVFKNLGRRQLQEMSLGSKTITNFRRNMTVIPESLLTEMRNQIRPLNIAGSADLVKTFREKTHGASEILRLFQTRAFGSTTYESDIAVPVPSARFDSIYTVDRRQYCKTNIVTPVMKTKVTNFSPLLILDTIHASPIPSEIPDMVDIPQACVESVECGHPTYKYILDHLVQRPVPAFGPGVRAKEMGGFMASFRLNFPVGTLAKDQVVRIRHVPNFDRNGQSEPTNQDVEVKIGSKRELVSEHNYINAIEPNIFFRSQTGHLSYKTFDGDAYQKARNEGVKATFYIQAKGHRPRYVETILRPTYTTFIEVTMSAEEPESKSMETSK